MEANELMLGDWVTLADALKAGEIYPIKITSLTLPDRIAGYHPHPAIEGSDVYGEDDLAGIPITPEILEKNGFIVDRYEEECVADYTFIEKPIYRYDEGPDFAIEYDGWMLHIINDFPEREISINPDTSEKLFVHELQHALRLCGIEKEIEL